MKIDLEVRDYECDVQGIVNNAVYLNYLEHARHKYLLAKDIDFVSLASENKNLVIKEAQYSYHQALKPDDKFTVETYAEAEGKLKIIFLQKIYRKQELVLSARIIGVCVDFRTNKIFKISSIATPSLFQN